MRSVLLILMIALLPLRSGAADVMAVAMAGAAVPGFAHQDGPAESAPGATKLIAVQDHSTGAAAGFSSENAAQAPCHGHAAQPGDAADAAGNVASDTSEPASSVCSSCQFCHSSVLAPTVPPVATDRLSATPPTLAGIHFASAVPAPGLKPPIF
ncbi:MAG: hypothetical protein IPK34_06740 [Ramlibacter sp.]|jgi:hypothetical protein|nr:hypothetical protein [Ramlibacter sp.]